MSMSRPTHPLGFGVLVGAVAFVAVGLPLTGPVAAAEAPVGGGAPGGIFEAFSAAAIGGSVVRLPVESSGGFMYAESQLNLDKARAFASPLYPGTLGDAFFGTSFPQYGPLTSQSNASAQNPPSETQPTKDSSDFGGKLGAIQLGAVTAEAETPFSSTAKASGSSTIADFPLSAAVSYASSTAVSTSNVAPDNTVVTEARTVFGGVNIADQVHIGSLECIARITAKPGEEPVIDYATTSKQATVGGTPATLGENGFAIAGNQVITRAQVDAFNEALKALSDLGFDIMAAPSERTTEPGFARVRGAAMSVRVEAKRDEKAKELLNAGGDVVYQAIPGVPREAGYDTEFRFGNVLAEATSRSRILEVKRPPISPLPVSVPALPAESVTLPPAAVPPAGPTLEPEPTFDDSSAFDFSPAPSFNAGFGATASSPTLVAEPALPVNPPTQLPLVLVRRPEASRVGNNLYPLFFVVAGGVLILGRLRRLLSYS